MAYVKPEYRIAKVHMAAGLFVGFTRDAKVIAEKLNTSERNVQRWAKTKEWATALEAVGYTGDLTFRVNRQGRDPKRENPVLFEQARVLYLENRTEKKRWQAAVATAEALGLKPRTIYNWAKGYEWDTENATKPNEHKGETV